MPAAIHAEQLDNGLTIVAETMPWLQSASFSLLLPAGSQYESDAEQGTANLLCDWVQRGCGSRDSRDFVESLDYFGVARGAGVSGSHTNFGGAVLADHLLPTLSIYADLVRAPHLPVDEFEEAQAVCFQELRALEDDLAQQTVLNLRRQVYPDPLGRHPHGTVESVEGLTPEAVPAFFERRYQPRGTILAVAGNFEWPKLRDHVIELFGDWQAQDSAEPTIGGTKPAYEHIPMESGQTHIGVVYPWIQISDPDFFQARAAIGVMSDGMSSRLFTEVREKRGLCYTVFASLHSLKEQGSILAYAGTSNERAQESLDVILAEFELLLKEGVQPTELKRLQARFKSGIVMQQESSSSRANSLASDWYHLGRVRSREELARIVSEVTCDTINDFLTRRPPGAHRVTTVGSQPLKVSL